MIDNTCTAVSVINNKGTSHNDKCNEVVCDIWALCEKHTIWLNTAAYIPGKQNIIADQESRKKNIDTEINQARIQTDATDASASVKIFTRTRIVNLNIGCL
jgi:hypothetical protein